MLKSNGSLWSHWYPLVPFLSDWVFSGNITRRGLFYKQTEFYTPYFNIISENPLENVSDITKDPVEGILKPDQQ